MIALGSDGTARSSREILLAGVSDYLVKPVIAAAVREAARAAGSAANGSAEGWLVGFAGTGGNGATTLAAAPALLAAERGRYASVLDLNRTSPPSPSCATTRRSPPSSSRSSRAAMPIPPT